MDINEISDGRQVKLTFSEYLLKQEYLDIAATRRAWWGFLGFLVFMAGLAYFIAYWR